MVGLTQVTWSLPDSTPDNPSRDATQALQIAQAAATDFESAFGEIRNADREQAVPTFHGEEVVMSAHAIRLSAYTAEHELRTVRIIMDLYQGSFGDQQENARRRFADRSIDGHYAIKYLQPGVIDTDHANNATTEMILETRILMNLAPHPNICQCYGVNSEGIESLLVPGRKGFFIITDRISESLSDRLQQWREEEIELRYSSYSRRSVMSSASTQRLVGRLEVALDIASALVYLHSRKLVYYLRPDKVGFDTRYGRIKLCQFGQTRQEGMVTKARSLTKSDDMMTLSYTAPEVFCKAPATTLSDSYAFGILLWELLGLEQPFLGWDRAKHFQRVVRHNERPIFPEGKEGLPKPVCELMENCWDPHLRPSMQVVHESLEMALLFKEDEDEGVKNEFLVSRRSSNSTSEEVITQRSSSVGDENSQGDDNGPRKRLNSADRIQVVNTPKKMSRRHSLDPQFSSQSTPGGAPGKKMKKKGSGKFRVAKSSPVSQASHADSNNSGRPKTARTVSFKSEDEIGALVGNVTPDSSSGRSRHRIHRSSHHDQQKESHTSQKMPHLLAKLGLSFDNSNANEEELSAVTTPSAIDHPSSHSGSQKSPSPGTPHKTPRPIRRVHRAEGSPSANDHPSSHSGSAKNPSPGNPHKTPRPIRRTNRAEGNGTAVSPASSFESQQTPNRRRRNPRHRTNASNSSPHQNTLSKASPKGDPPARKTIRNNHKKSANVNTAKTHQRTDKFESARPASPRPTLKRFNSDRNLGNTYANVLADIVGNLRMLPNGRAAPVDDPSIRTEQPYRMSRRGSV